MNWYTNGNKSGALSPVYTASLLRKWMGLLPYSCVAIATDFQYKCWWIPSLSTALVPSIHHCTLEHVFHVAAAPAWNSLLSTVHVTATL